MRQAFRTGASPVDFPAEDYKKPWPDRFAESDLNDIGPARPGVDSVTVAAGSYARRGVRLST